MPVHIGDSHMELVATCGFDPTPHKEITDHYPLSPTRLRHPVRLIVFVFCNATRERKEKRSEKRKERGG